jgi:transposase
MNQLHIKKHLSKKEIQRILSTPMSIKQYKRWQVILIATAQNVKAEEISEIACLSIGSVYKLIEGYTQNGPDSVILKDMGGRRSSHMSIEQEKTFLEDLKKLAEGGLIVTAKKIKKEVEKVLKKEVSEDYAYDLLHRHNWRKIVPGSKNPKKDTVKEEEFKKNSHRLWMPPEKNSKKTTSEN